MKSSEVRTAKKFLEQIIQLLEVGFFPGRKASTVLNAINYLNLVKEQTHASKDTEPSEEVVKPVPSEEAGN